MNHIAQIFNSKLSSKNKSPSSTRILLADGSSPESQSCRCSWSTAVLSKVKECRNTIKDIMTFEKINWNENRDSLDRCNDSKKRRGFNSVVFRRRMLANATVPDIITSNRVYSTNRSENEEETILIRSCSFKSDESGFVSSKRTNNEKLAMSYDKRYDNDSINYYNMNETSDSLRSFVILEKEVQNACLETQELKYYGDNGGQIHKTTTFQELSNTGNINKQSEDRTVENVSKDETPLTSGKKKISAEPFISYTQNYPELFWEDDVEENFSDKIWNSSACSNSTDITFDEPCQSSTFHEDPKKIKNIGPNPALHDSGFENNFSMMKNAI